MPFSLCLSVELFPWWETRYGRQRRRAGTPVKMAYKKSCRSRFVFMSICFPGGKLDMFAKGKLDICPLCGQSGGNAAGPYARHTERGLKSMDLAFKFPFFSFCFVPPYRSKDEVRGPKPGHSYWMKTDRKPYDLLKHIAGTSDLIFRLSRVGVQKGAGGTPQRAAKRHISSKVSAAELCISNGRQAIYQVPRSGTYRQKLIAGTINQLFD